MNQAVLFQLGLSADEGDSGQLFTLDRTLNKLYEHDKDSLVNLSGAGVTSPKITGQGIGGITDRLFYASNSGQIVFEVSPSTLLNISGAGYDLSASVNSLTGIGGIGDRLFICDSSLDEVHEVHIDTLTILNSAAAVDAVTNALGGSATNLFSVGIINDKFTELSPSTLLNISSGVWPTPGGTTTGFGGTSNRLYCLDFVLDKMFEIDSTTLVNLSGTGVSTPGGAPYGMGGTK